MTSPVRASLIHSTVLEGGQPKPKSLLSKLPAQHSGKLVSLSLQRVQSHLVL